MVPLLQLLKLYRDPLQNLLVLPDCLLHLVDLLLLLGQLVLEIRHFRHLVVAFRGPEHGWVEIHGGLLQVAN